MKTTLLILLLILFVWGFLLPCCQPPLPGPSPDESDPIGAWGNSGN